MYMMAESLTISWVTTPGVGLGVGVAAGWLSIPLYPMYAAAIMTITTTAKIAIKIGFFILCTFFSGMWF
jgi:hypothetical protein